jgi:hypothetical protein
MCFRGMSWHLLKPGNKRRLLECSHRSQIGGCLQLTVSWQLEGESQGFTGQRQIRLLIRIISARFKSVQIYLFCPIQVLIGPHKAKPKTCGHVFDYGCFALRYRAPTRYGTQTEQSTCSGIALATNCVA